MSAAPGRRPFPPIVAALGEWIPLAAAVPPSTAGKFSSQWRMLLPAGPGEKLWKEKERLNK